MQDIADELPTNAGFPSGPDQTLNSMIVRFVEEAIAGIPFVYGTRPHRLGLSDLVFFYRKLALSAATDVVAKAAMCVLRETFQPELPVAQPLQVWIFLTKKWIQESSDANVCSRRLEAVPAQEHLHERAVQLVSSAFGLIETSRLLRDHQLQHRMDQLLRTTPASWDVDELIAENLLAT
ncbi:hypothetical protein [Cryobacterium aureum]|uniref:hypothetical protein n=1 Tax=Cryobacterium aureum TaxID=995037 RepID=UPI000CF4F15B|nr:hypothetical protein [Cryobacterium aureum]